jgi:methylated-DNA-[protein]-cysteine S-methyltransferase
MKNVFFYETSVGEIGIAEVDNKITNVFFNKSYLPQDRYIIKETPLLMNAAIQLKEYLCGKRNCFELPLAPEGTAFRQGVWQALCAIPYGETRSYKDIACSIGNEKACRAVGSANNKNPIPFFIPCHRVIGADGKLVGYLGGLETKKFLLDLEKKHGEL